ncbi:MAG: hypothetical protein AAGJ97_10065, partial [Planctomycetota bacterium]
VDVPPKMVRCRDCRVLLNSDLTDDTVEVPTFEPLREITPVAEVACRGVYVECAGCHKELRINGKYLGTQVRCKHCNSSVDLTPAVPPGVIGGYLDCPHCEEELKLTAKYFGRRVACRHCDGQLRPLMPERGV